MPGIALQDAAGPLDANLVPGLGGGLGLLGPLDARKLRGPGGGGGGMAHGMDSHG